MNIKTRILLAVFFIELTGYGILLYHSHSQSTRTLINIREKQIQTTVLDNLNKINNLTSKMEGKAIELAHVGQLLEQSGVNEKAQIDELIKEYLITSFTTFPESIGGGLWYEPFSLLNTDKLYGPYVYWNARDEVEFTWELNTLEYNYVDQDWYLTALPKDWPRDVKREDLTYWTEPYWDEAGSKELMMTVDAIMYSSEGNIIGLSTVDWSLKEMTQFVRKIEITPNTQSFIVDSASNKILSNGLDRGSRMLPYNEVSWLKNLNIDEVNDRGVHEHNSIIANNIEYKLYYLKSDIGLVLGVMIPHSELYSEVNESAKKLITSGAIIIFIFIISMLFLLEFLFSPFKKVKELITDSLKQNNEGNLEVSNIVYEAKNEFTEIVEALNLTYEQINQYTKEVEKAGRAKTTFLTTMSHEIRTPMNGILGYTQLLALDNEIDSKHKETLSAIESSGNHLLSLLNDVLDISKIESGAMELNKSDVCLAILFDEIDSLFKLRCKMEGLQWNFESNIPDNLILFTDGAKIKQIIINLLGNSVKFTNTGSISLNAAIKNGELVLQMKDTGVGISEKHQSELFTPFFQSDAGVEYGGTGLGLTIVQKLIELLDGEIELVESTPKGTHFDVKIPAADIEFNALKNKNSKSKKGKIEKFTRDDLKALVVDDVKFNRDILVSVLLHMNVESIEAKNGIEALEKLADFKPDVIFIDIQMPLMDGKELMDQIKSKYPEFSGCCIAISANVYNDDQKYISHGFKYSLSKPFKINDVESMLIKLLK